MRILRLSHRYALLHLPTSTPSLAGKEKRKHKEKKGYLSRIKSCPQCSLEPSASSEDSLQIERRS